ncbi:hypothetical protein G7Y89_g13675 [Cudoniella acicularis]|uniref:Uncharacterized protein n=1 Tax=Cudoniella acicularis TaxID=354080 RepID=A0A8H4VYG0_9HELO|nr:hypothetical protein G7Y89_g13675 [Cudoniella acicularis]
MATCNINDNSDMYGLGIRIAFYLQCTFQQNIEAILRLIVAVIVTAAVELTISWNEIDGVHSLAAAGQTILSVIGVGSTLHVFHSYMSEDPDSPWVEADLPEGHESRYQSVMET